MHRLRGQQRQQRVGRPPSQVHSRKDRPKSRKVSKIRTVSTIHRTTKVVPPTKDNTGNATPQANDGDTEVTAEGEQAQPEPMNQDQAVQPPVPGRRRPRRPWPYGSRMPGFGAYRGASWHDSGSEEHEERTEHDDPIHPAPTSDVQDNPTPSTRTSKRCRESQAKSEA